MILLRGCHGEGSIRFGPRLRKAQTNIRRGSTRMRMPRSGRRLHQFQSTTMIITRRIPALPPSAISHAEVQGHRGAGATSLRPPRWSRCMRPSRNSATAFALPSFHTAFHSVHSAPIMRARVRSMRKESWIRLLDRHPSHFPIGIHSTWTREHRLKPHG